MTTSAQTAFYPGSFDPPTFGHLDIVVRAARLFQNVTVGVGIHHGKLSAFSPAERVDMLEQEIASAGLRPMVRVVTFDGLAVEAARRNGASVLVRGLRDGADYDYEAQMAGMNADIPPGMETVFLVASPRVRHIAGRLVRQIASMNGDVSSFVSPQIAARLTQKFANPGFLHH